MAEAAAALGVSVPTVRQMVARGQLVAFRTPGGHLRFTSDSVRAAKGEPVSESGRHSLPNPLQNRRERVEELTLEAQEFRAERQLEALRREQEQEESDRQAETEALRQERRDQARASLIERQRIERQEREERDRRRAAQEEQTQRERFVSGWLEVGLKEIPDGVPPEFRLEVTEQLTAFLQDCRLQQRELISQMVSATVGNVLAPWRREREIAAIVEEAGKTLPFMARGFFPGSGTEWDLKARQAAFSAITEVRETGSLEQIRTAARVAVRAVVEEYEATEQAEKTAREKAQFLDHWFLHFQLSGYVRQLIDQEAIELEPGETVGDVADGLETAVRKHLGQRLTGTETRAEVLKLLREFVRAEFKL